MKSAEKARSNGLYRHIRTSKEIIRNLLNDLTNTLTKIKVTNLLVCHFLRIFFVLYKFYYKNHT